MRFMLFYVPPCGDWYVHSHKLYKSEAEAFGAAVKFLPSGAVFAIKLINTALLDENHLVVA